MAKKIFLVLMFLFGVLTYSQNSTPVEQTPDAILLNDPLKNSPDELKSIEEVNLLLKKTKEQKNNDEATKNTKSPNRDAWGDAINVQENKQKTEEYSNISDDDLYEILPDGTRKAKYPFIPAGAKTIEDIEKYFKEHPLDLNNSKIQEKEETSIQSDNSSGSTSNIYGIIIIAVLICFVIAEIFGRSKHIGRWWTFFLLLCGFIPGIIALSNSPSAKAKPTKGGKAHYIWAWIFLIFGALNATTLVSTEGQVGHISLVFFMVAFYFFELNRGLVINRNPKYYF